MRIVRVDDLVCEAVPEGQMVLLWNEDVPGVIGNVGGTIAKHGINIAAMSWQRQSESGNALVIVNVDGPMPDEVLEDLRSLENLQDVRRVTLPPIDESLL
jgi:D-3-phosphoglycerate dehydrogenase